MSADLEKLGLIAFDGFMKFMDVGYNISTFPRFKALFVAGYAKGYQEGYAAAIDKIRKQLGIIGD